MPRLTDKQKHILGGALAVALGVVAGVTLSSDAPTREAQLEGIGSAVAAGSAVAEWDAFDGSEYHRAVRAARDADPELVDLLTAVVEPGAVVKTGVNVARGSRPGAVDLTGPSNGRFEVVAVTYRDGASSTWIEVHARNTSPQRMRLTAMVRVESPPP